MGQCLCCVRLRPHIRRSRQYRHKRFEFNPTRPWKFRDSAIRTEFQEMSVHNQDAIDEDLSPLSGAMPTVVNGNRRRRGSDEDDGAAGEVRRSGRLVFSEQDNNSPNRPDHVDDVTMETEEVRSRSWSNSSEKMGRFEVWTLDESALDAERGSSDRVRSGGCEERARLIADNT